MKEISWKQFFAIICINLCKNPPTVKELAEIMGSSHRNEKMESFITGSIIAVLCFVLVLATLICGTFWVFFITSVLAAGVESMFVIMQRYNRPRVISMIEKDKNNLNK